MNKEQVKCDKVVKDVFKKYSHNKCTCPKRRMYCVSVTGKFLNTYLTNHRKSTTDPTRFNSRKKYNICTNLHGIITKAIDKVAEEEGTPLLSIDTNTVSTTTAAPLKTDEAFCNTKRQHQSNNEEQNRAQRLFLRQRIPADDPKLKGVKKVCVSIKNEMYEINTTKMRVRQKDRFREEVLDNYYKVPFGKLSMRQRRVRMAKVGKIVLGACIERSEFKANTDEYLHNNIQLGVEVLNLLDGVKEYVQSKMKVHFDSLTHLAVTPIENDTEGVISKLDEKNEKHKLAITLLGETTTRGYQRVRNSIATYTDLPSYYMISKDRPKMIPIEIQPLAPFDDTPVLDFDDMQQQVLDVNEDFDIEVALQQISELSESGKVVGAAMEGEYEDYIKRLEKKHEDGGRIIEDDSDVFVLDSIDGAEHLRSKKKITSVISFSSSLTCGTWINNSKVSAGNLLNILTWQQLRGKETIHTMLPAVEPYFHEKKRLRESTENRNYYYYDLHDGKMLYLLTQHSQWSRKNYPFLLCKCGRGEGVTANETHVCKRISHEEQIVAYGRSAHRWDLKRTRERNYSVKDHMDWVDDKNGGMSHFGLHPDLLPRDGIRFDTFHMKCAITRKLMGYLRRFMLNQSNDMFDAFMNDVLKKFWNDFHLYVWKNKKNFSSFLGNELALFVSNVGAIVEFLDSNFTETNDVKDMKDAFQLWVSIFKFLGMTVIGEDSDAYNSMLRKFELQLKKFYDCGSRTFLSSAARTDGNEESFYCHALRFYMIDIAKMTYERHKVGIGVFNMQGFERRNKESKNCMKRFSNNRGNVLVNNMKRVWDVFKHDINAV